MKAIFIMKDFRKLLILLQVMLFAVGCSDDDDYRVVDDLKPNIELEEVSIRTDLDSGFTLLGKVTDTDGLSYIQIVSKELHLNKRIDLVDLYGDLLFEYNLDYSVTSNDIIHSAHAEVMITACDVLGNFSEEKVIVDFTADYEKPQFISVPEERTFLASSESDIPYSFNLEIEDNKELALVTVAISKLNYTQQFNEFPGDYRKFATTININFPGAPEEYEVIITASDYEDNVSEYISEVYISDIPNYAKMYIVAGEDESIFEDNIFGVPMMVERVADFIYETGYYTNTPNTEVRLLPQKSGFAPIWYGIDAETDLIIAATEMSEALPLVIEQTGYTKIRVDILTGEYSLTPYTPTDPIPTDGYLSGIPDIVPVELGLICPANWWGHELWPLDAPQMLVQDANSPWIYTTEFDIAAGTTNVRFFIGPKSPASHPGWWFQPFYRWDDKNDPEANIKNDGQNPGNWSATTGGTYVFEFDSHLLRSKLYLKR